MERSRSWGHAEVFALLFALGFLAARFLPLLAFGFQCPFLAATGLPCATCGMTRAFVHAAHGEMGRALAVSPLGAVLACGSWGFVILDAIRLAAARPWPRLPPAFARAAALTGAFALLANWAYIVVANRP
jgi:hypothetical protein